jgi:signal transduction histidine kinase
VRLRLITVALAVASVTVIAFVVPLGWLVHELANDRALTRAARDAQLVGVQIAASGGQPATLASIGEAGTIGGNDLTLVLGDGTAMGAELRPGEEVDPAVQTSAGSMEVEGGIAVYSPAVGAEGEPLVVRVFVAEAELDRGVRPAWLVLGLLGLGLIVISVAFADRLGRSFVRPIEDLSDAASSLGAGELATRVEPAGPPEIREVGTQFNNLAERVARLLESERETAADLSHRLRTPMAALRLDAEGLESGADRERVLDDLSEMERVVDYVIREVRRPGRADAGVVTDLSEVVRRRVAFWGALADEQGRRAVHLLDDGPLLVTAPPEDLEAAVDALVGNVFAHTPEGVAYSVTCTNGPDVARLIVDDAGSGFGEEAMKRGHSGGGSTGLGLDIARRTAETGGGSLTVGASPLGGARVVLEMPSASPG